MKEFKDRLRAYRSELNIPTQTEMAKRLGITRQLYSNLESGYKSPSERVLNILINDSNLPAEYWLYGVDANQYLNERREFKCLYTVVDRLKGTPHLDLSNGDWSPEVKEMFISALKADITHLLLKDKKDS